MTGELGDVDWFATVTWDGCDESGIWGPVGIDFYRMQAGQFDAIRKLILIR